MLGIEQLVPYLIQILGNSGASSALAATGASPPMDGGMSVAPPMQPAQVMPNPQKNFDDAFSQFTQALPGVPGAFVNADATGSALAGPEAGPAAPTLPGTSAPMPGAL